METANKPTITVANTIHAPVEKVWQYWTEPGHIVQWNSASDDWHTPHAENDLKEGGKFSARMEAKDGSFGFDFWGIYDKVTPHKVIAYTLGDGRKVSILFDAKGSDTQVTETFEPEGTNPIELQQGGWQAIMDNFKKYTENN